MMGGILVYRAVSWVRKRVIFKPSQLWAGLALLSVAISIIEAPILIVVFGAATVGPAPHDHASRLAQALWASPGAVSQRQLVYRLVSYSSLILAAYLLGLWRGGSASVDGSTPQIWRALATVLACLTLLNLPACYGRLIVPYERPLIELMPKGEPSFTGFVLNPQGEVWSVWVRRPSNDEGPQFRVFEVKSLPPFRILRYADLFAPLDP